MHAVKKFIWTQLKVFKSTKTTNLKFLFLILKHLVHSIIIEFNKPSLFCVWFDVYIFQYGYDWRNNILIMIDVFNLACVISIGLPNNKVIIIKNVELEGFDLSVLSDDIDFFEGKKQHFVKAFPSHRRFH